MPLAGFLAAEAGSGPAQIEQAESAVGVSLSTHQKPFGHQTRMLLWVGFGGLLLLMAVLGVSALSFLNQIQVRQEKIREDYVERDLTLEKIRSDIYTSGTYLRDYLLDTKDEMAAEHKAGFLQARRRIESGTREYERLVRPAERPVFEQFQKESHNYLQTVSPALDWTAEERLARGANFVSQELLPRRMLVVDLTDRMHELTEKQLEASSMEVADLFATFRMRLLVLLIATLGIGLALAGSSLRRILAAHAELKRLSAELLSAQEDERRRISRELHDEVGQVLSAIMLGLGNLRAAILNDDREEALGQLQLVQDMTQRNANVVRNISLLLRPTMLDDLGLVPALKWLAREVSRTSGIQVDVVAECEPEDLTEDQRTCVYRVVQEAVHNAARHSRGRHIVINLQLTPEGRLRVSVDDDGAGFDPSAGAGLGILGMKERIQRLSGVMHVDSSPAQGTVVTFDLPPVVSPSKSSVHRIPTSTGYY
jgi:signal transduction histidine kinase